MMTINQVLDQTMQGDSPISDILKKIKDKVLTHEQLKSYFMQKYAPIIRARMLDFQNGTLFHAQRIDFTNWVKRTNRMADFDTFYEVKAEFDMAGIPLDDGIKLYAYERLYQPVISTEMKDLIELEGSATWNTAASEWHQMNQRNGWMWRNER